MRGLSLPAPRCPRRAARLALQASRNRPPSSAAPPREPQQLHPPPPQQPQVLSRRDVVLNGTVLPLPLLVIGTLIGSDDPTTIINSVLSGWGGPDDSADPDRD